MFPGPKGRLHHTTPGRTPFLCRSGDGQREGKRKQQRVFERKLPEDAPKPEDADSTTPGCIVPTHGSPSILQLEPREGAVWCLPQQRRSRGRWNLHGSWRNNSNMSTRKSRLWRSRRKERWSQTKPCLTTEGAPWERLSWGTQTSCIARGVQWQRDGG